MSLVTYLLVIGVGFAAYKSGILDNLFTPGTGGGGGGGSTPPPAGGGGAVPGTLKFASVGDIEHTTEIAQALADSGAQAILINGDFYYSGDPQSWWDTTMAPVHSMNVHATIGNHDSESDAALFGQESFNMSWKDGPVAFISVNTESLDEAFVRGELDKFQADTTVGAIIPFMHKPIRTPQGSHHAAENGQLHDLFTAYSKVRLVLCGHNHQYTRMVEEDGKTYVTVGTGHDDFYPVQADENTEVTDSNTLGILVCDYNNGTISCSFQAVGGGSFTDSFSINVGTPTTTPPIPGTPTNGEETPPADEEEAANYARAMYVRRMQSYYAYHGRRAPKINNPRRR